MATPSWRRREEERREEMNAVIGKLWLLILVLAAVLVVPDRDAVAALASSYHDGAVIYDTDEGLTGFIEFAVYDTEHEDPLVRNEYLDNGLEKPGDGQYIYAYQIFSLDFGRQEDIAHFAVLGVDGDPIDAAEINGTEAQDDDAGGIAPSPMVSETQGVWKWTFEGGYVSQGEHSSFLVFSSDQDWTAGTYEVKGPEEVPVPVPEPGMLVLLGLGSFAIGTGRRMKCR
jgi:hypothetical protein